MSFLIPHKLPDGSPAWVDTEVLEFTRRLEELSPRLALFKNADQSWTIAELGDDGRMYLVIRSKPGARLGPHVIRQLQEMDIRRPGAPNPAEEMIRHNDRLVKERQEQSLEKAMIAFDKMLSKAWRGRVPVTDEGIEAAL